MTVTFTAACPSCRADTEWTQRTAVSSNTSGEITVTTIACQRCDKDTP